ncbi:MAG: uracil phosphoribosyltransferase [Oscillospiraceae bacterium]|jgi:uracil phosphoribosyltransferase|nr:uracil phosphoribosyltransferase [Oscillospiraceae bacterium]
MKKIMNHPLIQHKISIMRDKNTGTKEFRELISETAMLICYEATRDLPLKEVQIETPLALAKSKIVSGKKIAVVAVLRAGLGMVDGVTSLIPSAKIGHIGLYREERNNDGCVQLKLEGPSQNFSPMRTVQYYAKLPEDIADREVIILDPMLATASSANVAIQYIKDSGVKNIKFLCILAAPQGIANLENTHPDVDIYCGALDEGLNENNFILPGLGDAGDRMFGTK